MIKSIFREYKIKIYCFIIIAFITPWLFVASGMGNPDSQVLGSYLMILPASAIILGRIVSAKSVRGWLQWLFLIAFALFFIMMSLWAVFGLKDKFVESFQTIVEIPLSVVLFCGCCLYGNELYPFKNIKGMLWVLVVFYLIEYIFYFEKDFQEFDIVTTLLEPLGYMVAIPFSVFLFSSILLMGEEYAWRGCIQTKLQAVLGKRKGVIILGIIWECWHIPAWFGLYHINEYEVTTMVMVVIYRFLSTVGMAVFMGWAYMKTENIWCCVLIHGYNNAVGGLVTEPYVLFGDIPMTVFRPIVLMLFLFAKEYRKENPCSAAQHQPVAR